MAELIMEIEGMTCGHCVETVSKAIEALSGVTEAVVKLEESRARVSYDAGKIDVSEIAKAVEAAGYAVIKNP
ncbi:MAG: heavy-metal-associated domain-containing protein [Nitrospiria bacterium]